MIQYKHKNGKYFAEDFKDGVNEYRIVDKIGKYIGEADKEFFAESSDWKKVVEYPVGTKVIDSYTDYIYTKQDNGKWNLPATTIPYTITDKDLEGDRYKVVKEENPWKIYQFKGLKNNKAFLHSDGNYYLNEHGTNKARYSVLINPRNNWVIQTISNGKEEFSVGEVVEYKAFHEKCTGRINSFKFENNILQATFENGFYTTYLESADRLIKKPVLYTTSDGVPRFEYNKHLEHWVCKHTGDDFYTYLYELRPSSSLFGNDLLGGDQYKIFSTKAAALKFIEENKPKVYELEYYFKLKGDKNFHEAIEKLINSYRNGKD